MNKGRISRRGALVATAITVFATPAFASLVVQNFMEADISVAAACFVKVAGNDIGSYTAVDADDPNAGFDGTTNTITVDGAGLLEEKLTVRGMIGDRVTYTDVVRYQNNCNVPLDVTLVASAPTATGDWTDRSARIYLSSVTAPTGNPGAPASGWDATPIVVDAGTGNIPVTNAQTGTVTVAPGAEIRGAISVSAGVNAVATGIGTVNWVAEAENSN
jgi:hypothetical protein